MKFDDAVVQAVDFSQNTAKIHSNGWSFNIRITDPDQARWLGARINRKVTLTIEDPDA